MSDRKPIDKQYLLDSLKNFDQEILSKKYSNTLPGLKGDKGDPGKDGITYIPEIGTVTTVSSNENASASVNISEEGHKAIYNFSIPRGQNGAPGESVDIESLETVDSITETDKFLVNTTDGNHSILPQVLADELYKLMNLTPVTPGNDTTKIPFVRGFRLYMKDFDVKFMIGTDTFLVCELSDLNITDLTKVAFVSGLLLDTDEDQWQYSIYVNQKNSKIYVTGNTAVTTAMTKKVRVCLAVRDAEITDGAGETPLPVLPGYDMIHKKGTVSVTSGSQKIKIADLSEFGLVEDDVAFCYTTMNISISPTIRGWNGHTLVKDNAIWFIGNDAASSNFTSPVDYTIVYKTEVSLPEATLPNIYDATSIPAATVTSMALTDKMLLGTPEGNKIFTQNDLVEFLKGQDLIDLDGKGRPLLPGYGIVTKDINVTFSNATATTAETYKELLGIENFSDIVFLNAFCKNNEAIIYGISVENDKLRIRSGGSGTNVPITVICVYKLPVPYEPGLKSVSLTKTINMTNKNAIFADLSEFGDWLKKENVVNASIYQDTGNDTSAVYPIIVDNIVKIIYPMNGNTYNNQTFTVTLLVKDYSSIGPEIVTDGIRMITKEFSGINFESDWMSKTITNIDNFDGVESSNVLGMDIYVENFDDAYIPGIMSNGDIRIARFNGGTSYSNLKVKVSLFVKVPVVETKLKPFVKDIEGTFTNAAWTTLLTLDGSEEVGGFTINTIGNISIMVIDANNINLVLSQPIIQNDGRVQTLLIGSGSYPGKVRVKIDPK